MVAVVNDPKLLADFLSRRKALIFDYASGARTTVRKLLTTHGMPAKNISSADSYEEALEKLATLKPQIAFIDYELKAGQNGLDFFKAFKALHPNRVETLFFLISEKGSDSLASRIAEEEVDSLVVRPFTYVSFEELFLEIVVTKIKPTDYLKIIEEGKTLLAANKAQEALTLFAKAKTLDPKPGLACYHEGMAYKALNQLDKMRACFEEGLETDPIHYKCLFGLFDLLMEAKDHKAAYAIGAKINQNHPINPNRIPDFVRLSVVNKYYDDILNYYQIFATLDESDANIALYIAAGLVICAKALLKSGNVKDALNALTKAETVCQKKPSVLKEILLTLFSGEQFDEAERRLSKYPDEVKNAPEILVAELTALEKRAQPAQILQRCLDVIKQGVKQFQIYDIAIKQSVTLKRGKSTIEELIQDAGAAFPDKTNHFQNLLPKDYS